jgi:MFS family permease
MEYYAAMRNEGSLIPSTIRDILTRDFLVGFLSLFAFVTANAILIPTLPLYLSNLGSNETQIGILIGVFGAASLIFRILVGGALLKYSEKSVMMAGAILFAITFFFSIVLRPFWPFFAVRFFQGIAFACLDTAVLTFIIKILPPANRGQGISYFLLGPNLALVIGPSFGMFVINHYNFTILFLICAGLSLCAFLFSCKMKSQKNALPLNTPLEKGPIIDRKMITPSITVFLQNVVWGSLMAFFPLYAVQCGVGNPGLFFSAIAVMLIAGRILGGRILDNYNREKIIMTFIGTSIVAMIMIAFAKTLSMFIFIGLFWGIGGAFLFPAFMTHAFDYAGSSSGTSVGTFRALGDSGLALGPMIIGIIIPFTGYKIMFLCLAFICLINLNYFYFVLVRKHKPIIP